MEIILLEDIPSLGNVGDLVKVSDGYGRNYLIPHKLAIKATPKNRKKLEHEKRFVQGKTEKTKRDAEKLATKIEEFRKALCPGKNGKDQKGCGKIGH
jgi:large subunit ribosomal protein L9